MSSQGKCLYMQLFAWAVDTINRTLYVSGREHRRIRPMPSSFAFVFAAQPEIWQGQRFAEDFRPYVCRVVVTFVESVRVPLVKGT